MATPNDPKYTPLNVLFLIQNFYPINGGAEEQAKIQAEELAKLGYNITVVTGKHENHFKEEEVINGVRVLRFDYLKSPIKIKKLNGFFMIINCYNFLIKLRKSYKWDIIHVHQFWWMTIIAALLKIKFKTPFIAKSANSGARNEVVYFYKRFGLVGNIMKFFKVFEFVTERIDRIVCINGKMQDEFLEVGVPKEKLVYIPNSVRIPEKVVKIKQKLNTVNLLWAGRIVEQKNIVFHLETIRKVKDKGYKVKFDLYGTGDLENVCREYIRENGLEEYIELKGSIEHSKLYDKILNTDIYIHFTFAEGMSNAVLEMFSFGVPSVLSAVPGNTDLAGDYNPDELNTKGYCYAQNCVLIKDLKNSDIAANTVIELIKNYKKRLELSKNSSKYIRSGFSPSSVMEKYIKVYNNIIR